MIIALDAMGGDLAPQEVVKGAVLAARELNGDVALVGIEEQIQEALRGASAKRDLVIRPATEIVGMEDSPRTAIRSKPDSSLAQTVEMVRTGEADACVSAGNSGAYIALCHTRLKTIPGILRPGIALALPTPSGPCLVIDAGANVDCKPVYLQQFGVMGSIYVEFAWERKDPRVGLLSIGTESQKGNELTLSTMPLLEEAPINFIGNVEGDQILSGDVDVIVCDGFAGNIVIKVVEGTAGSVLGFIHRGLRSGLREKIGAFFMGGLLRSAGAEFDYGTYGGALLLGVNGICVVSHGKSDANAIKNALLVAERSVKGKVNEHVCDVCTELFPQVPVPA